MPKYLVARLACFHQDENHPTSKILRADSARLKKEFTIYDQRGDCSEFEAKTPEDAIRQDLASFNHQYFIVGVRQKSRKEILIYICKNGEYSLFLSKSEKSRIEISAKLKNLA